MEPLDNFVPFTAFAFLRPDPKTCLFNSVSKWLTLQGKQCLYHVPPEFEIIETDQTSSNSISISCVLQTKDLEKVTTWDPLAFCQVDFPFSFEQSELTTLVEFLIEDWNERNFKAGIIALESVDRKGSRMNNGMILTIFGLKSKLAIMEIELKCTLGLRRQRHTEAIDLKAVSMLPLLAGQNRSNWSHLSRSFHTDVVESRLGFMGHGYSHKLYLQSDEKCSLLLAKQYLESKLNHIIDNSLHATAIPNVSPLKMAYLRTVFPSEALMDLMQKYPSYVNLTTGSVQLQSSSAALLDVVKKRFVRNVLAGISEVRFWLNDSNKTSEALSKISKLKHITSKNNVILSTDQFKNHITFVGSHESIKQTCLDTLAEFTSVIHNVRFTIELDTIYKDFISGKKNGKLMKIMEQRKCAISLENDPSGNMLVILQGEDVQRTRDSFLLLLQELPCERSFFIPEAYHRPVIGAGGSVIQTIMRKNNVFIQFSNSFQLPQEDWTITRYDNVIIRCPSKNSANIAAAKEQLLNLSEQYSQVQKTVYVKMSPTQYLYLIHSNSNLSFISEIEKVNSCYISFPQSLPSKEIHVTIKGNDTGPEKAANDVVSRFGREIEIIMSNAISETEFSAALMLPLNFYNVEYTHHGNLVGLAFSPSFSTAKLDKVLFLIESFLKNSGKKIISKREITHYTSVTPLYRVGKNVDVDTSNNSQASLVKGFP
ncbi:unnamed protein product [Kluyveromyces dobzhanskii CBS 2104]|uniref:WGS project CCBQ000000000 data, contig 00223 n=1 Tax=Kluyveromyces dobzhanskii CBS 2104 TaxID=1427455 RepID=A0A0A8L7M6_9SACH|nr:unnamed protein product [Kluyveromyces dobzhanskii CBS 2104]